MSTHWAIVLSVEQAVVKYFGFGTYSMPCGVPGPIASNRAKSRSAARLGAMLFWLACGLRYRRRSFGGIEA